MTGKLVVDAIRKEKAIIFRRKMMRVALYGTLLCCLLVTCVSHIATAQNEGIIVLPGHPEVGVILCGTKLNWAIPTEDYAGWEDEDKDLVYSVNKEHLDTPLFKRLEDLALSECDKLKQANE